MDNVILDVVIGLVLIYALLAVLLTSLQEMVANTFFRGRVAVMHRLLHEASGQDPGLKDRLLKNPLLFALSEGEAARGGVTLWRRATGPSAVPPDVYARALLMELDPATSGKPASETHATPQDYVDALVAKGLDQAAVPGHRVVRALRGLVVGHEGDWPRFEAAIATWFTHIGDRSEGWFKRLSSWWTLYLALALSLLLNADSFHIAGVLGRDAELRGSLATLAENVVAQRDAAAGATSLPPPPPRPEVLASARLVDAYNRLRPVYFSDDAITRFEHRLMPVQQACTLLAPIGPAAEPDPNAKPDETAGRSHKVASKFVSDAEAWIEVLPSLLPHIEHAVAGYRLKPALTPSPAPQPAARSYQVNKSSASDSDTSPAETLQHAHQCLIHVSAWVRAATMASGKLVTQTALREASVALEDSKAALLALVRQHGNPASFVRLYHRAPESFSQCAQESTDPSALRRCVDERLEPIERLPLGLTRNNLAQQLCSVSQQPPDSGATQRDTIGPWFLPCQHAVQAQPQLGLSAMSLRWDAGKTLGWVAGLLVTTLALMLGAPFWFDVLSKAVRLRAAGRLRSAQDSQISGAGTAPPAAGGTGSTAGGGGGSGSGGGGGGGGNPTAGPTPPGANGFEATLTRREIVALQQTLDVPGSGVIDAATRTRLRERQNKLGVGLGDELTPASYLALVGRPGGSSPLVLAATGRPRRGQAHPEVQSLARNLMHMLQFEQPDRIPATETVYSDELRALAVLLQFKNEALTHPTLDVTARPVFDSAREQPARLDELDDALKALIFTYRTRKTEWDRHASAPWLDWALGELGQVENDAKRRDASNPRICSYLDEAQPGLGDQGDATPWCGAFVAWVLERHNSQHDATGTRPAGAGAVLAGAPAQPALAASWLNWGTPQATPQAGDVVVVNTSTSASGNHVGWCFHADANHVWLLGGNQSQGGRVCLSRFARSDIQPNGIRRG